MKLGVQVALGPGHIVLDGDLGPLPKGAQPPIYGPCLLWPNGWMDQDTTWYDGRPRPGQQCVRCGPSSTPKEHSTPPSFWPMSVVAISATAEHLFKHPSCYLPSSVIALNKNHLCSILLIISNFFVSFFLWIDIACSVCFMECLKTLYDASIAVFFLILGLRVI